MKCVIIRFCTYLIESISYGTSSLTVKGTRSNLYKCIGIHLRFQKSDVSNSEFFSGCQFYRPDGWIQLDFEAFSINTVKLVLQGQITWNLPKGVSWKKLYVSRYSHGRTCALLNSVQTFIEIQGWQLLTFFICLHNQLSSFNSIIVQISEKRDSSNSKNEWLLLSVTFTAKLELVFVLTFENAFS